VTPSIAGSRSRFELLADSHGDLSDPKLVLFVGRHYFFTVAPFVHAFQAEHPDCKGRSFWETIPRSAGGADAKGWRHHARRYGVPGEGGRPFRRRGKPTVAELPSAAVST